MGTLYFFRFFNFIHCFSCFKAFSIFFTLFRRSFLMSDSQILITVQPCFFNSRLTSLSLSLFLFIFFSQNSALVLGIMNLPLRPCQKSESTNTATFFLLKTKSGFPNIVLTFFAKYIFSFLSSAEIMRSGNVPSERIFCMFFLLCSGVSLSILPYQLLISVCMPALKPRSACRIHNGCVFKSFPHIVKFFSRKTSKYCLNFQYRYKKY